MWHEYFNAATIDDVLPILAERGSSARVVAGGTDLIIEMERNLRKGVTTLVDVTRIPNLDQISLDEDGTLHLGPMVTHNHCVQSRLVREYAFPLAKAAWEVGSPQIRNRGTVAGNLITASPANDTISPLMALNASVTLRSVRGTRNVPLRDFYTGVRKNVMAADEMLVDIFFPRLEKNQRGTFVKFALRRAQAISVLNATVILSLDDGIVTNAAITLGAVAPTIIHAAEAEEFLRGKPLNDEIIEAAAEMTARAARPIDDVRGSAAYRQSIVRVVARRSLVSLAKGEERDGFPLQPVLLWGKNQNHPSTIEQVVRHDSSEPICTTINGKYYEFTGGQHKTLLRLLREDAGLIGTKEGCAEGECGACTVFLDGVAVMSCLVPAPRAHGAEIVTVEGVSTGEQLHPVQQAFVEEGAVQCGYCTPGFVMSAVKLLEERPHPSTDEIKQSLTGNLCRCTGYYKIIKSVEKAAAKGG